MSAAATTYASLAAIEKSPGYWTGVIRRFRRDPVAMVALAVVIALVLMALLAPYIAPVDPYRSSMIRRLRPVGTRTHAAVDHAFDKAVRGHLHGRKARRPLD